MPKSSLVESAGWRRCVAALLALLVGLAYVTSFSGVFVFDDLSSIVENPTIRPPWRFRDVLALDGGHGATIDGRPVLNLSFVVNYAISGTDPWSYHAANLMIHVGAALALFGIVRRTCENSATARGRMVPSTMLAGVVALGWALHPLQTQAVTYVVQRAESLMGLCYLLTLYCFIRGAGAARSLPWYGASFAACLVGMGVKETMVSAPVIVLAYDRIFLGGSWSESWRRRGLVHGVLASTWILMLALVASSDSRGGTAGFSTEVSWWSYALTQCHAVIHYLRLAVWPNPLVFDYGTGLIRNLGDVGFQVIVLLFLLVAAAWAFRRRSAVGFLGAWFFLILAPSSSVVPVVTQTMAEHRMYLPLAAVVCLVVFAAERIGGRRALSALLVLALAGGWLTAQRNRVYRSELALWADTVSARPDNPRARTNLGIALVEAGRIDDAIAHYRVALQLDPNEAATHLNLAEALRRNGHPRAAVIEAELALRLDPASNPARINLGYALLDAGEPELAVTHFERALQVDSTATDVRLRLATALLELGRAPQAIAHYETALRSMPGDAQTWCALARALLRGRDYPAARRAAERALQLQPNLSDASHVLGDIATAQQDFSAALGHYRRAFDLAPDNVRVRNNLANVLLLGGRFEEAIAHYREILRVTPDDRSVQENLAHALELQRSSSRQR